MFTPTIDQVFSDLARGKQHRLGVFPDSPKGPVLLWTGHQFRILTALILYKGQCWDESSFPGYIFLKQDSRVKPAWYMIIDRDLNCTGSSFDDLQSDFVIYALMQPNKSDSDHQDEESAQNIPICLKAIFSSFGSAVTLVQDRNFALMWQAEMKAILSQHAQPDIHGQKEEGGPSNEFKFLGSI